DNGLQRLADRTPAGNKVLPKAGLNGFDWTFVQGSTLVILLNFCVKIPRTSPMRFPLVAIHKENFRLKNLPKCNFYITIIFMKVREVIAFKNYFEDFLSEQPINVQDKIYKIIE